MLNIQSKKHESVIFLVVADMGGIGARLQKRIIEEGYATSISNSVSVDVKTLHASLRLDISDVKQRLGYDLFENDLIGVKIDNELVTINCNVYSNYGIDQVYFSSEKIEEFKSIFAAEIEENLYQCLVEHIAFFDA